MLCKNGAYLAVIQHREVYQTTCNIYLKYDRKNRMVFNLQLGKICNQIGDYLEEKM